MWHKTRGAPATDLTSTVLAYCAYSSRVLAVQRGRVTFVTFRSGLRPPEIMQDTLALLALQHSGNMTVWVTW